MTYAGVSRPPDGAAVPSRTVTAVLTCHNRRVQTVACLEALQTAAAQAEVALSAIVVDDASTDGTADALSHRFPWAFIVQGNGSLYWNRGMHLAMQEALNTSNAHYLLWLNDDTLLLGVGLERLMAAAGLLVQRSGRQGIVVGATADRNTGQLTYGGSKAASCWKPFTFQRVFSETDLMPCDVMNGNVVLLPMSLVRQVGNLDPAFEHAMGDIDYALRARKLGHAVRVAPGFVATCSHNPVAGSFQDTSLPLRQRWALFVHRKVLPPRSWLHLTRRHGGWLWPLHFAWPYASFFARASWSALRKTV